MRYRLAAPLAVLAVLGLSYFGPAAVADTRLAASLAWPGHESTLAQSVGYDGGYRGYRGHWGYPSYPRNYGYSHPRSYRPLPWYGYYLYEYRPYVRRKYRRKHRRQHYRARSHRHHHHRHRH
ncbi:MAG: hypothetical protein ACR2PO_09240 [Methyloligellaceae bacterium]